MLQLILSFWLTNMPITNEHLAHLNDSPYPETASALAEKWGPLFNVSPGWVRSHIFVESTNRPLAHNKTGGAFGFMQLKVPTATDIVRWMKASGLSKDGRVAATLKRCWRGQGEDLLNPDLNVMLGTFYLGYLKKKFGSDHDLVSAAYNQGPGALNRALKAQKLTSAMKDYIAKIENAEKQGYA